MAGACSTSARWARAWPRRRRALIARSIAFAGRTGSAVATSVFGRWNGRRRGPDARSRRPLSWLRLALDRHVGGAHLRAQRRGGAAAPSAARLSADQPVVFDYTHCVASVLHAMDRSNRSEKTRPHITTSSRGGKSREKNLNI